MTYVVAIGKLVVPINYPKYFEIKNSAKNSILKIWELYHYSVLGEKKISAKYFPRIRILNSAATLATTSVSS